MKRTKGYQKKSCKKCPKKVSSKKSERPRCTWCSLKRFYETKKLSKTKNAVHLWVRTNYGKASTHPCSFCGLNNNNDWANKRNKYIRDIKEFFVLCRPCHKSYDLSRLGKKPNTGERNIHRIRNRGYQVVISRTNLPSPYHGTFPTLEEAKKRREEVLTLSRKLFKGEKIPAALIKLAEDEGIEL